MPQHGVPASMLTDNGAGLHHPLRRRPGGRNGLETELRRPAASPRRTAGPATPRPRARSNASSRPCRNGWPPARPPPPSPSCRPSSTSSPPTTTTPAAPLLPRRLHPRHRVRRPAQSRPRRPHRRTHYRVRPDLIDDTGTVTLRHAGQLYHIGVGRAHARTHVLPARPTSHPRHQRRHRRTPPRAHPRPRPQLPAPRPPARTQARHPANGKTQDPDVGSGVPILERSHGGAGGIRTHTGRNLNPVPLPLGYGPKFPAPPGLAALRRRVPCAA